MWSYGNPGASLKDQVRFLVGDTRPQDPYLQDEEISFLLSQVNQDPTLAAIAACQGIMSRLARSRDETVGSVSIAFSQTLKGYEAMLDRLKMQIVLGGGIQPYAGGISYRDKAQAQANPDWQRPDFSTLMMRSPWVSRFTERESRVSWEQYPQ